MAGSMDSAVPLAAQAPAATSDGASFQLLFEHAPDYFVRLGPDKAIRWISSNIRRLGHDPADLVGTHAYDLIHPDDRRHVEAVQAPGLSGDKDEPRVFRYRTAQGNWRRLESRPTVVRDQNGEILEILVVLTDVTDRFEDELAAGASRAELGFLIANSSDLILRCAPDGRVTWVSPNAKRLGYRPERILDYALYQCIHPDDLPGLKEAQDSRRDGGPDMPARFRFLREDGDWEWTETKPTSVRDGTGTLVETVVVAREVNDRVEIERQLAAKRERFRAFTEGASDILATFGPDSRFTFLSDAVRSILGYEPHELVGESAQALMHAEDFPSIRNALRAHLASPDRAMPFAFEYRAFRKDGRMVRLASHARGVFDPETGKLTGFNDIVRDVTKERAMEAELAASEERFRQMAENANDLIMESRLDGTIAYLSPAVYRVTGYSPSEVMGQTAQHWVRVEDWSRVARAFSDQVSKGAGAPPITIEYRLIARDGREIWMESSPHAKLDPRTGAVVAVTDIARDISVRKQLELDLALARDVAESATRVKADFLANMSHEIRTPLTAILGYSSLLAGRDDLDTDTSRSVSRISRAGQALLALVNDTLDFSKLEAGLMPIKPRPTSLDQCLNDALALFEPQAATKGVDLKMDLGELPGHVLVDPDRLRQVLLNLIGNGLKFTHQGSVTLAATYDDERQRLAVEVRDTGNGMDAEQQQKLFRRFSQVDASPEGRQGGTGLGLAISLGLVEAMQGQIGVTSAPGSGSTFWFDIAAPVCEPEAEGDEPDGLDLTDVRLLVADDNRLNRELVRVLMEPLGVIVIEASDGNAAISLAQSDPVDVILMDLRMPDCAGPEATQAIRSLAGPNQHTPILAFSADADIAQIGVEAGAGFDGFVHKPIDPMELVTAIVGVLAEEAGPPGDRASPVH